jgi:23S rRNA (cytidine1920-2'-O)/16S rRNA (cytidine1409-2'-O)-methyltransferase
VRLDRALVARGLARSRSHAQQLVDSGRVVVGGQARPRVASAVGDDTVIRVEPDPYVSRGAHKLIGALDAAAVAVPARVLDAGASTGGFTQVVLERGAEVVYAVDVGHGQLAPALRHDRRVRVAEGLNLRDLTLADVGGQPVGLVVADVSFISLRLVLERLLAVLDDPGVALVLVKPQFEVGRGQLDSHGVVVSEHARSQGVAAVVEHAEQLGWELVWSAPSVLAGEKGNREVFCLFRRQGARR